jgi:hypothetical protein
VRAVEQRVDLASVQWWLQPRPSCDQVLSVMGVRRDAENTVCDTDVNERQEASKVGVIPEDAGRWLTWYLVSNVDR